MVQTAIQVLTALKRPVIEFTQLKFGLQSNQGPLSCAVQTRELTLLALKLSNKTKDRRFLQEAQQLLASTDRKLQTSTKFFAKLFQ
jgi:hypothetical protein